MADGDTTTPQPAIRCIFFALRGADLLFERTVDLVDLPRIGERVQMWFTESATVRDVHWNIPQPQRPP